MVVGKLFFLLIIFYGCNGFFIKFYERYLWGGRGIRVLPTQQLYPSKVYTSSFLVYESEMTPYTFMAFGRSRRALPGTTKKLLDSCKDTSVRAVWIIFYIRKIFNGCNGFLIKFYKGYHLEEGWGVMVAPPQRLCPSKLYTRSFWV